MSEQPLCKCHGEKMIWSRDSSRKAGGYWKCVVKTRANHLRYQRSEKGRKAVRKAMLRYRLSEKGREKTALANARRIRVGNTYIGKAPSPEIAAEINAYLAKRLTDFKSTQQHEREEASDGWRNRTAVA